MCHEKMIFVSMHLGKTDQIVQLLSLTRAFALFTMDNQGSIDAHYGQSRPRCAG